MRRIVALAVAIAMSFAALPVGAAVRAGRAGQAQGATLAGTATNSAGQTVGNTKVQLRNLATGQLMGSTMSSASGGFSFEGLAAGNYAVEVVNAAGQIIGTSASVAVAAGATVTGVVVSTTGAAVGAAAGGAAAGGAAAGAGISTTAVVITSVAVAAGIAGAVAIAANNASPSR